MAKDADQVSEKDTKKQKGAAPPHALKMAPKPHSDFIAKGGKGPRPTAPKTRNFRHQGR
jgi:hypothetical protein